MFEGYEVAARISSDGRALFFDRPMNKTGYLLGFHEVIEKLRN